MSTHNDVEIKIVIDLFGISIYDILKREIVGKYFGEEKNKKTTPNSL